MSGATENLLTAAVVAKGTTVIDNAAREPEIADLCHFLVAMGAEIVRDRHVDPHRPRRPVDELRAVEHRVVPDRLQAATYLAAVGVCGGEIEVVDARAEHMEMLLDRFVEMGDVDHRRSPTASSPECPNGSGRSTWRPFRTRVSPPTTSRCSSPCSTVADGVGIVTENLYPGRFRYVDELQRLGADIRTNGHHAVVRGVATAAGRTGALPDIRAGAALVVAGLAADGETSISDVHHIDRGYEDLVGKLASLGGVDRAGGGLIHASRLEPVRPDAARSARARRSPRSGRAPAGSRPNRPGGRADP